MLTLDFHPTGHHFLQIPGPSPVPDRILRALSLPTIDHRGPEFGALGLKLTEGIKRIFKTVHPVMIYPSSGTGAWEAALVNVLSPGDHVLMYETGQFAALWIRLANRLGLSTEVLEWRGTDSELPEAPGWRHGVQAALTQERL
jgi:alanine-glyoxylate transaminase/serine-glyoxylate transaminase/serine-pyruvate transaminase